MPCTACASTAPIQGRTAAGIVERLPAVHRTMTPSTASMHPNEQCGSHCRDSRQWLLQPAYMHHGTYYEHGMFQQVAIHVITCYVTVRVSHPKLPKVYRTVKESFTGGMAPILRPAHYACAAGDYQFETNMLKHTTCSIYTFDCTYNGTSIHQSRHHYYKWCIGTGADDWRTWSNITQTLGHPVVDLLKMDVGELGRSARWRGRSAPAMCVRLSDSVTQPG